MTIKPKLVLGIEIDNTDDNKEELLDSLQSQDASDEDEWHEHHRFLVDKGTKLLRMDKYLTHLIMNVSRNKIQKAAKAGCILVNGKAEKQNYRVKPLDVITILLPSEPKISEIVPENIPLEIVYEDPDIIIINKEAGMVVHPAFANYTGTLVNALTYRFLYQITEDGEAMKPLLVHRIDKNTSGILIIAKNEYAQMKLAQQFFNHSIERKYCALVWGDFQEDKGTIIGHVGRHPKERKIMTVFPDGEHGKHAVTHWKVVERFGYVTLIECQLETGRTHQIRVHLQHIGHPLFNDATYGGDKILKGTTSSKYKQFVDNCFTILSRQALHAQNLGFVHPISQQTISFESTLPNDMQSVIDRWRQYAKHIDKR